MEILDFIKLQTQQDVTAYLQQFAQDKVFFFGEESGEDFDDDYDKKMLERTDEKRKEKEEELFQQLAKHLPIYVVHVVELENKEKSKRHYLWILGVCYLAVIGKGAFGQVFLTTSGDRI